MYVVVRAKRNVRPFYLDEGLFWQRDVVGYFLDVLLQKFPPVANWPTHVHIQQQASLNREHPHSMVYILVHECFPIEVEDVEDKQTATSILKSSFLKQST